jgi:hypothetical protein
MINYSQSLIGFSLFCLTFAASYYFWDYYRKSKKEVEKANNNLSGARVENIKNLLDTTSDSNYLHGETDKYNWSQNENEIELILKLQENLYSRNSLTKKDVYCVIKPDSISVSVRGQLVLQGDFYASIDPDECNWQIGIA